MNTRMMSTSLSMILACVTLQQCTFACSPRSTKNIEISKLVKQFIIPLTGSVLSFSSTVPSPAHGSANDLQSDYDPSYERIYDTYHKSYIPANPYKYLVNNLKKTNVITIGEIHSNICHHKLQFDIIRAVSSIKSPSTTAIGLECFYRQHQVYLDRFVYVHQDLARLKYETDWDSTWGYDLNYYAKIFSYAAKHKIRLVGLNLPYPVAKLVSEVGMAKIPDKLRAVLPDIDLNVKSHKQRFIANIGDASHFVNDPSQLDRLYETQTLWDEYMSESAAQYLDKFPTSTLVIIAGLGHVQGRVAIPDRLSKRIHSRPFVIIPQSVRWNRVNGLPILNEPLSPTEGDWIWYVTYLIFHLMTVIDCNYCIVLFR